MLESFLKALLSDKSRFSLQLSILIAIVWSAFYLGRQVQEFIRGQERTSKALETLISDSEEYGKNAWTYEMQKEWAAEMRELNKELGLIVPVASEIKIKLSN